MHKIASAKAPKNWSLWLNEKGIPIVNHESISLKYLHADDERELIKDHKYTKCPDMPVYSAKIRAFGKSIRGTNGLICFQTDDVAGSGGECMLMSFTNDETVKLFKLIAMGAVLPSTAVDKDGNLAHWFSVRITFKRCGVQVVPSLFGYGEV